MIPTITCHHCGKSVPCNPRIKKQKYCSSRRCQNMRRRLSAKEGSSRRYEHRLLRKARNKRWRDARPGHEYQKEYRKKHPEYVKRNIELQKGRNKKRKPGTSSMIVKTYALFPQPLQDGLYRGLEAKNGKIVKTYALLSQMLVQAAVEAFSPRNTL
jgi:hypothetical protein